MADFVDVVVFSGHPEDGDSVDAFAPELLGNLYGHQRFVDRVRRPAERPTCWPLTTGTAPFARRSRFSCVSPSLPKAAFCLRRISATVFARSRGNSMDLASPRTAF